jgi:hypothetical protein
VPAAGGQVFGEPGQAWTQELFAGLGEDRHPGAHRRIEVGLGSASVGGGESVGAVVRDQNRLHARAAE